jgi:hypothetical protein
MGLLKAGSSRSRLEGGLSLREATMLRRDRAAFQQFLEVGVLAFIKVEWIFLKKFDRG